MLVTLASRYLSDFRTIPSLYAKVPALCAKISDLYAYTSLFGFHCSGNVRGRVAVGCHRFVANDSVRAMRG